MSRYRLIGKAGVYLGLAAGLVVLALPITFWVIPALQGRTNRPLSASARQIARARGYLDHGRPELALRAVSGIGATRPEGAEALAIAGLALARMNQVPQAREAIDRSLKLDPNQPEALKVLAAIFLASGDGAGGLALLKRAAELDPNDFRPWVMMGDVHHDMTQPVQAANAYVQALKRKPGEHHARLGYIRALLALHRADDATTLLADALREQPDDPQVLGYAVWHAQERNKYDEALAFAERAVARNPRNFEARFHRAKIHIKAGRPKLALEDLRVATKTEPFHLGALELLATVEGALGQSDRAAETWKRARRFHELKVEMDRLARSISARPNDPKLRWKMGQIAAEGGIKTLAEQSFRAALELDPQCREALDGLDALRSAEAAATASQAAELEGGNP